MRQPFETGKRDSAVDKKQADFAKSLWITLLLGELSTAKRKNARKAGVLSPFYVDNFVDNVESLKKDNSRINTAPACRKCGKSVEKCPKSEERSCIK